MVIYLGIDSFMFSIIYAVGGQIELMQLSVRNIENKMKASKCDTFNIRRVYLNVHKSKHLK